MSGLARYLARKVAPLLSALVFGLSLAPAAHADTTVLAIDPSQTFLRTNSDPKAANAVAIDLASLGLKAGDSVLLQRVGAFAPHGTGPSDDIATGMVGVFSASSVLLDASNLYRVQDALSSGVTATTSLSFYGAISTDIPQDFAINSSALKVVIPQGANFLFIAASDSYWGDNTDPNADFQVYITPVPEPTQTALFAAGLGLLAVLRKRRQSRTA